LNASEKLRFELLSIIDTAWTRYLGRVTLLVLQVNRDAFLGPSFYRTIGGRDNAEPAHQRLDILASHSFGGHLPKSHLAIEKRRGQTI
jgi:hypothetical protein